jgi:hypothetical protein
MVDKGLNLCFLWVIYKEAGTTAVFSMNAGYKQVYYDEQRTINRLPTIL